jgi:glycosyltransferase involved in cell wall biosynthesis
MTPASKQAARHLQVAVIGCCGVPARYGGFETLAEHLVAQLQEEEEIGFSVYCDKALYPDTQAAEFAGARLHYLPLRANGWQSLFYDAWSCLHAIWFGHAKVILALGVSGAWVFPLLRLISRVRIATNVDGIEWQRKKWRGAARQLLKLLEWFAVRFSHRVIADNAGIAGMLAQRYGIEAATIAYGGDHALQKANATSQSAVPVKPYALTVCRIEPENNIHLLAQTFADCAASSDLRLVIVGNWAGSAYAAGLHTQFGGLPNIDLLDPVYERDQLYALRQSAACFVHGHSAGGTNPTLVEAMFFGKPMIAFDCVFNRNTTEDAAVFFSDAASLRTLIEGWRSLLAGGSGSTLKQIAERRYQWRIVAQDYAALIKTISTA